MMDAENKDGANMTQQSVLNAFDFSAIEEMDPSLGKSQTGFFIDQLEIFDWDLTVFN